MLVRWPDTPAEELTRSSKITAFISPVAPGSAYAGSAGDSLDLLVPDAPGSKPGKRRIGINMIPKPPEASTRPGAATGVIVRASTDKEGDRWLTIGRLLPREHWSTETIGLGALDGATVRRLRLVWQSRHTLGRIGVVSTAEPSVSAVTAVSARHSDGTDVSAALERQDRRTVTLRPGEYVDLAYDVSRVPSTSKLVLLAHGRYFPPGVEATPEAPAAYFLGQNRPNPFNPMTTIEFGIPSPGKVSLRIFDVSGRLVQTLVDRELPAGFHHADWDGRARSGSSVSSGIYFYELRSGSFAQKRRMVLIR
ncbi:MAG TPA: FlgD immunoglobulin-like domain containing protein [Dehalococcoidia bacterium]|jgi:hypothetical protein|nr:FlgD immunoglobulin-like domain containing protein [Dehalococcoidia bacterium]